MWKGKITDKCIPKHVDFEAIAASILNEIYKDGVHYGTMPS